MYAGRHRHVTVYMYLYHGSHATSKAPPGVYITKRPLEQCLTSSVRDLMNKATFALCAVFTAPTVPLNCMASVVQVGKITRLKPPPPCGLTYTYIYMYVYTLAHMQ